MFLIHHIIYYDLICLYIGQFFDLSIVYIEKDLTGKINEIEVIGTACTIIGMQHNVIKLYYVNMVLKIF